MPEVIRKTSTLPPVEVHPGNRYPKALLYIGYLALCIGIFLVNRLLPDLKNQILYLFIPLILAAGYLESTTLAAVITAGSAAAAIEAGLVQGNLGSMAITMTQVVVSGLALHLSRVFNRRIRRLEALTEAREADCLQHMEAVNLENDRLHREINKNIFDMLTMYEFTTILGSTLNPDEVIYLLVDTVQRVVKYDGCSFWLVDEVTGVRTCRVNRGLPETSPTRDVIIERVARTMQPFMVADVNQSSWNGENPAPKYRSLLSLPLVSHGRSLGVLNLYKEPSHAFSQDDLRILFIISNLAAWAIKNAQLYEQMTHQAITDGLTGLYNHRYFREAMDRTLSRAEESGQPVSMIMLDIDSFKAVNDKFGHQRGDMVIREVAALIRDTVRAKDLVARYGGEEFAVILPETPAEEAFQVAERIRVAVKAHDFEGLRLTVSAGVATYPSADLQSRDELISRADAYAYRAKERGKDNIVNRE